MQENNHQQRGERLCSIYQLPNQEVHQYQDFLPIIKQLFRVPEHKSKVHL